MPFREPEKYADASSWHVVTGAFGYSGQHIARQLLAQNMHVRNLTASPARQNPLGSAVEIVAFDWQRPASLARALEGAAVLYNTYWVRFNTRHFCFAEAVHNSATLIEAAKRSGVRRIVHVSITNPDKRSRLEYFRGKASVERALAESGVPYTILRPAVLFGGVDILVNNIAWALRHLPIFGIFGDGEYRLQPIHVEDFAALAVQSSQDTGNRVIDAIGPETFTYRSLVETVAYAIGAKARMVHVPPTIGHGITWIMGKLLRDVIITRDEIRGLMENRLYVDAPAAGTTKLSEWAKANRDTLGRHYASELARRRNRLLSYENL